jgi:hypothetical protein
MPCTTLAQQVVATPSPTVTRAAQAGPRARRGRIQHREGTGEQEAVNGDRQQFRRQPGLAVPGRQLELMAVGQDGRHEPDAHDGGHGAVPDRPAGGHRDYPDGNTRGTNVRVRRGHGGGPEGTLTRS